MRPSTTLPPSHARLAALLCTLALLAGATRSQNVCPEGWPTHYPAWWYGRGVVPVTASPVPNPPVYPDHFAPPADGAVATVGQLKFIARAARDELASRLAATACPAELAALFLEWDYGSDDPRTILKQGQLKHVGKLFYDWLHAGVDGGYVGPPLAPDETYPWGGPGTGLPDDDAPALLGQVKRVFAFDISTFAALADSDGDGLPDAWELEHFGNLDEGGAGDLDEDGTTNAVEWMQGTAPAQIPDDVPAAALALWVRADAGTTRDKNQQVTAWRDFSGQGVDLAADAATAPTRAVDAAGRPFVDFDGDDLLQTGTPMDLSGGLTIYAVFRPRGAGALADNAQARVGSTVDCFAGALKLEGVGDPVEASGGSLRAMECNALSLIHNPGEQTLEIWLDGQQLSSVPAAGSVDAPAALRVGGAHAPALPGMDGELLELMVYSRALSGPERERLELRARRLYGAGDADGDGMADWLERQLFENTDPGAQDDSDGDGVANIVEIARGTNPTIGGAQPGEPADEDEDGLSDEEDAVPYDGNLRFHRVPETAYALVDVGPLARETGWNEIRINDRCEVVGYRAPSANNAFAWSGGATRGLVGWVLGLDEDGRVVGNTVGDAQTPSCAARWDAGSGQREILADRLGELVIGCWAEAAAPHGGYGWLWATDYAANDASYFIRWNSASAAQITGVLGWRNCSQSGELPYLPDNGTLAHNYEVIACSHDGIELRRIWQNQKVQGQDDPSTPDEDESEWWWLEQAGTERFAVAGLGDLPAGLGAGWMAIETVEGVTMALHQGFGAVTLCLCPTTQVVLKDGGAQRPLSGDYAITLNTRGEVLFSRGLWQNGRYRRAADLLQGNTAADGYSAFRFWDINNHGVIAATATRGNSTRALLLIPLRITPDDNMAGVVGDTIPSNKGPTGEKHFVTPKKTDSIPEPYVTLRADCPSEALFSTCLKWESVQGGESLPGDPLKFRVRRGNPGRIVAQVVSRHGGHVVDQMNVWVVWAQVAARVGVASLQQSQGPPPFAAYSVSQNPGTLWRFTFAIEPRSIIDADDRPALDIHSDKPVPGMGKPWPHNTSMHCDSASFAWDTSRQISIVLQNPGMISQAELAAASYPALWIANQPRTLDNPISLPTLDVEGNDDPQLLGTVTSPCDPYHAYVGDLGHHVGEIASVDAPAFGIKNSSGAHNRFFSCTAQFREFARVQLWDRRRAQGCFWFRISDHLQWHHSLQVTFTVPPSQWTDTSCSAGLTP